MADITPRDRVLTAIRHQQPDRVPYQISCTVPARRKLENHYGTAGLDDTIGNHLAKFKARPPDELGWIPDRPGFWQDEWGVTWNRTVDRDIGVPETVQLRVRSLADLAVPDPLSPCAFQAAGLDRGEPNRFRYVSLVCRSSGPEPARDVGAFRI
jgi:uroporphyrinogen decarboxylase